MPATVSLDDSVQFVRGVGPARANEFEKLGVRTVRELIEHFPFRHELKPRSVPIGDLTLGVVATVVGELRNVRSQGSFGRSSVTAKLVDGTGTVRVRWFHSAYLAERLHHGSIVRLTGQVDVYRDEASLTNPEWTLVEDDDDPFERDVDRYEPIYPATAVLPSRQIARIIDGVLDPAIEALTDFLPEAVRVRRGLPPLRTAILRYHRPTTPDDVPVARRRLAYDELLLCQLGVQISRERARANSGTEPIVTSDEVDRRIRGRLPFALTGGQNQAVAEIRADLARPRAMNRLLQADVGAGKTAVAVYAALAAIANRRQVAVLAPTEVLAAQHLAKIERYLAGSRVRIGGLTGSTTKAVRASLLRSLAAGDVDLIVGTHALLEPDVRFRELGLVIIDEQHKFGVEQRSILRKKGRSPHTIVLTATPIPRTLAMTVFGDLDVSTIREPPPNRRPVETTLVAPEQEEAAWRMVRERLAAKEQAYIVYPLVEESETLPLKAATVEVEALATGQLAGFRIELLHGRMKPSEKAAVMARFRNGETQALVSTTVIEVGVDVPNATVMVIQHADRYGLSQLHQLRGRIGRGTKDSCCLLMTDKEGASSFGRLRILCETSDGFRIAEEDLRLRGPGELLGTRQHGIPAFKAADLIGDFDLLEQARDDAAEILQNDKSLAQPEHASLRAELRRRYQGALGLIDVA